MIFWRNVKKPLRSRVGSVKTWRTSSRGTSLSTSSSTGQANLFPFLSRNLIPSLSPWMDLIWPTKCSLLLFIRYGTTTQLLTAKHLLSSSVITVPSEEYISPSLSELAGSSVFCCFRFLLLSLLLPSCFILLFISFSIRFLSLAASFSFLSSSLFFKYSLYGAEVTTAGSLSFCFLFF